MEIKEILEQIALPCRSNKKGFKDIEKLEAIENLLKEQGSEFHLVHKSPHSWIFGKKEPEKDRQTLLISSHADIVDGISNPYSDYLEEERYFQGTYDNLGTNAASVYAMLNGDIPDNVYFAFTADEETGRCNGAWDALSYIVKETQRRPFVFALDVTDEGYDENRLFTIEGLHARTEEIKMKMIEKFLETEGEKQSFEIVPLRKKDDYSFLPKQYKSDNYTVFDESVFYAKSNCNSCSLCLPGDGNMHGMSGFYVKEAVMKGYCESLITNILAFTMKDKEILKNKIQKKDEYISLAQETPKHRYQITMPSYYSGDDFLLEQEDDSQIPGQLSLADFDESFAQESRIDIIQNQDLLEEILDEIYDVMVCYDESSFELFYNDVLSAYGIKDNTSFKLLLKDMFEDFYAEAELEEEF